MIPVADPGAQYRAHKEQIDSAISRVTSGGWYILGKEVEAFEKEFADFVSVPLCTSVANGTDALMLALRAVGIGYGDEVITVSHSAVATVAAIELTGAIPVFADIDPLTRCMNPSSIEGLISGKTKAIVPVHIFGHPADMGRIMSIADLHGLKVIEDCAQAHGASINNKKVGTLGHAAAFSFYPTKNLGAIGDGGAVVTKDSETHDRLLRLRQYGWKERYISEEPGCNSRLDELQAAILRVKLPYLSFDNSKRREIAKQYSEALQNSNIKIPFTAHDTQHAMHLYVLEVEERDTFEAYMKSRGIATARHYPLPIHAQPAYKGRIQGADKLPVTEMLYKRMVTLPLYPELGQDQVKRICLALKEWSNQ